MATPRENCKCLDINDFNEVFKCCDLVRAKWKTLASYLGVDRPTVEAIEKDEVGKVAECLQNLISAWLKRLSSTQPQPSWRLLCDAMSRLDAPLSVNIWDEHKCKCSLCTTEFKDYRVGGSISAGNPLLSYGESLRSIYNRANPTKSKWPPCLPVQYTSLAVVKKERLTSAQHLNEFTRSTLRGDVDQILCQKEPMDMQDILKIDGQQQKLARCVFMEGAPGIGKSTFAWELCHQWKEIPNLKNYSAVVFVSLREKSAQQANSIHDLMPLEPSAEVISTIERQRGAGILWVLDGLDELPGYQREEGSIYLNLITGKLLPHSSIIVTTRPSVTAELFEGYQHCIDKRVEILGFNTENIIQYAHSYFHEDRSMFLSFIICFFFEGNPKILQQLMYVPMNLAIFSLLHEERFQDNTTSFYTTTELYNTLTCSLIKRHLTDKFPNRLRIPELVCERDIESYLPREYQAVFKKLLFIAHKNIVQSQDAIVVFDNLGEDFEHLGLMNCISSLSLTQGGSVLTHQFVHLTLQEYLAALHHVVTQQPFEALCTKSTQAAIFFVGIADKVDKKSIIPDAFLYIQEKMKPENVNIYDEDCEETGENFDYHDLKWNHLFLECFLQCSDFIMENEVHVSLREFSSPFYFIILGKLLSQYDNIKASITIENTSQFYQFLGEVFSKNQMQGLVTYFSLKLTIFDIDKCGLQKFVSFDAIKSMHLIINQYNALDNLFSGATLNNLQELLLWGNDNSIKQHCLKILSKVSSLKKLYVFTFTTLVSRSCIENLNSASCLKRLNILPEFDSVGTLNDFIASVFGLSSLEVLILRRVDFKECNDTIIKQLATNTNIKELTLVCCRVTTAVVEAVSANKCLEEFGLCDDDIFRNIPPPENPLVKFDITDSGVIPELINLVKTCSPPLTTFALQYKHFTTEACIEIVSGALCNDKLTRISLYDVTVNAYYHALNQQQSSINDDHQIIRKEKFHIIEVKERDRSNFFLYVLHNYPIEIAAGVIDYLGLPY